MLSRTHRFHGRKRINEVYRQGKQSKGELFGVRMLKTGDSSFRVAVVVSKKVAKSAVIRNRIRRKIYSCFNSEELNTQTGADIIVNVFSAEVATAPTPEIISNLKKHLDKLS